MTSFLYFWPIALVVLSNIVYHICCKSMPDGIHPFASLAVTYFVGAVTSVVLYYALDRNANFFREIGKINWTSIVLGITIVGLEVGFLYAYKIGWQVSTASIVQSAFLTIALLFVGLLLYKEALTWNKVVGIAVCLIGLLFINLK